MSSSSTPPPPLDVDVVFDATAVSEVAGADDEDHAAAAARLLLACPPLRWGLLGCGRVSHDFCQALRHVPTASVVACATKSDAERAQQFATRHGIPSHYGTYAALLADGNVDIVYVGTVHAFRREIGEQCLLAGKHVLLEKPFCCTVEDAEYLVRLAAERNLFLQEGMWTRFFPAVEQARRIVNRMMPPQHQQQNSSSSSLSSSNIGIGEVVSVMTDFNFDAADSEAYPDSFVYQRKLGGGASLHIGPYPIAAALLFFGGRQPDVIQAVGQVDAATGVDLQAAVTLRFAATTTATTSTATTHTTLANGHAAGPPAVADPTVNGFAAAAETTTPKLPGAGVATLCYGMLGESEEVTTVLGTQGRLTIESPCHCPTHLTVQLKGRGRGQAAQTLRYHYPLPADTAEIVAAGGYHYPNSAGFCYEAAAVARCVAAGLPCCPQYTLAETLIAQRILQETRLQLRVKAVDED